MTGEQKWLVDLFRLACFHPLCNAKVLASGLGISEELAKEIIVTSACGKKDITPRFLKKDAS